MKKIYLFLALCLVSFAVNAQIKTPALSPLQKLEQKVGLVDVKIEYSRPSMRGRTIFGELEPFNELWRTGANRNTKITFSSDVKVGGKMIKAGTYAIFTKPNPDKWEVYFYNDTTNWDHPETLDAEKIAAQFTVTPEKMPMDIETLTFTFDDLTNNSANLGLLWENTYIAMPIEVPTDEAVMKSIESTLAGHADDFYSAADYYLTAEKDLPQAKMWIEKSISMRKKPTFWVHAKEAQILSAMGDKKAAIKAGKLAIELAKKAERQYYVDRYTALLKEIEAK